MADIFTQTLSVVESSLDNLKTNLKQFLALKMQAKDTKSEDVGSLHRKNYEKMIQAKLGMR